MTARISQNSLVRLSTALAVGLVLLLPPTTAVSAEGGAQGSRASSTALQLYILDCGTMGGVETGPFLPGVEDAPERFDMVNRCFLVVHQQGLLLWDAGFPTGFRYDVMAWFYWLSNLGRSSLDMGPSIAEQLESLDIAISDVDYVAFSHSHFDHVGQANQFSHATWLVQKIERDWAFSDDLDNESVWPGLYAQLEGAERVELAGDHDVFGDGTVEILSSPGHTPGHQCLYLDLPETGPVVLSGDLYHSTLNRELRVPPDFNTDADETRRSMERIEGIAAKRGAQLWIQHSPESGPQAPTWVR